MFCLSYFFFEVILKFCFRLKIVFFNIKTVWLCVLFINKESRFEFLSFEVEDDLTMIYVLYFSFLG